MTGRFDIADPFRSGKQRGFTLLEMILAMTVVTFALMVVVQAMARVQDTWKMTHAKVRQAQDARAGMETLSRTVIRATLNGRWELSADDDPKFLRRASDLHFVCGPTSDLMKKSSALTGHAVFFQAPYGYPGPVESTGTTTSSTTDKVEFDTLPGVLNAWGYFVEFGPDPVKAPAFITGERRNMGLAPKRYRFRLMEFRQPAQELSLFQMDSDDPPKSRLSQITTQSELYEWFNTPLAESYDSGKRHAVVIAENILGFIIQPLQDYEAVDSSSSSSISALPAIQDPSIDYVHDSRRFQWEPGGTRAGPSRHRLPAALKITMIVLDEKDWDKLSDEQAQQTGTDLRSLMSQRFSKPSSFTADLGAVTGDLNRRRMKHREITSVLRMPGSRWTTDREN